MDKDKIMDAMEYIDPALVEEAGREAPAMKRGWRGWSRPAVIAACLCAVLAGTAVAAELSGVRIVDIWNNEMRATGPDGTLEEVSGVTISRGIRYFSIDEFSQQIIELDQGFTEPAARSFSSWEEMEDFVGIRVMGKPRAGRSPFGRHWYMWACRTVRAGSWPVSIPVLDMLQPLIFSPGCSQTYRSLSSPAFAFAEIGVSPLPSR